MQVGRGIQILSGKSAAGQPFPGGVSAGLHGRRKIKTPCVGGVISQVAGQSLAARAMMANSQATGTTASRRPGGPGNDAGGRSFQELVASAKAGDVEAQSLLAMRYMVGEGPLEEDLREGGMFNFTDGMRHLDTMPPDVRLAIFKHLDAADLCRLGCTSWSVESWLRIQPAIWAHCLATCESASHDSPVPNRLRGHPLPRNEQEAYCFSLSRLESMSVAAAPYAEVIAAYADALKYGEKVGACAGPALFAQP